MKATLCFATVVAVVCFIGFATQTMRAQPGNAQPYGTKVAVIDMSRIIREHPPLQRVASETRSSAVALRKWTEDQQHNLRREQMKLTEFRPDSSEYSKLEEQIADKAKDLKLEATRRQRELLERESRAHYDICMRIREAVARLAERERIGLVIRYNSAEIDPNEFRSVQEGLLRRVIYQDRLDITTVIQDYLVQADTARRPSPMGLQIPGRQR